MISSLVVAVDGSELSESVLPYASSLARSSGARLTLVRAVPATDAPSIPRPSSVSRAHAKAAGLEMAAREAWALERAENDEPHSYLHRLGKRLEHEGLKVDTHLCMGDATDVLLEAVDRCHADLIMLATHGRSGFARAVYGSVAEAVVTRSPVPVFLSRAGGPYRELAPSQSPASILVPLDGSRTSEAALPFAGDLARTLSAELCLVRAVEVADAYSVVGAARDTSMRTSLPLSTEPAEYAATAYLAKIATRLGHEGCVVRTAVHRGRPDRGIVEAAEQMRVALVIMAVPDRNDPAYALRDRTAHAILHYGYVPIIFTPSRDLRQGG